MAASIPEHSQGPQDSTLKQWSRRLAIVGLCVEIFFLVLRVSISVTQARLRADLPHFFVPLTGILISLAFLVIYPLLEKDTAGEQDLYKPPEPLPLPDNPRPPYPVQPVQPISLPNRQIILPSLKQQPQPPFIVPLEGNNPSECDDKADFSGNRYAVTDGVSQSFMPAQWAKIIARRFVERKSDFSPAAEQDFTAWLQKCSDEWEQWVRGEKLPQLEKEYPWTSWDKKVEEGAQTTLIGCSLFAAPEQTFTLYVTSIGDAYFFLFRRVPPLAHEQWVEMCPPDRPQGDNFTNTFKTLSAVDPERAEARARRSLDALQYYAYRAHVGDIILLVSDKLALWIYQQVMMNRQERLIELLMLSDIKAFRQFVFEEREARTLVLDDTTLFLIPLNEQLYRHLPPEQRGTNPVSPAGF